MLRTRMVRITVGSLSFALLVAAPALHAQNVVLDNSCAISSKGTSGAVQSAIDSVIRNPFGRKAREVAPAAPLPGLADGPICAARSAEELLLLTGLMMDRAALSAARGVDSAQIALGRKRTLETKIAELERAVNGLGSGNPSATEVVIKEIAEESEELSTEIKRLRASNALDEEAQKKLAEAQRNLNEVTYYSVSAGAGGKLFTQFMKSGKSTTNLYAAMASPRVGFSSDFAQNMPERATKVPGTVKDTVDLKGTISEVVKAPESASEGDKRAKERAQDDAKRIQEAMKSSGITVTPL